MFITYCFLRDMYEGYPSLENADLKQSNSFIELKNFEKGTKTFEKKFFLSLFKIIF